ncbi:hypothetical protein FRC10_001725, partial [Ceratobasidium sp. 414]
MEEGTKIDEHVRLMRSWHDTLRQLSVNYASSFDWAIQLPSSLPSSWDVLIQTLQSNLHKLSDPAQHEDVAQRITSKIMAEGQRKERKGESDSALFAQRGRTNGYRPKQGELSRQNNNTPGTSSNPQGNKTRRGKCNYCQKEGHWERECRKKIKDGKKKAENVAVAEEVEEVITVHAMMAAEGHLDVDWIADSGAESHFVKNATAFSTYKKVSNQIVKGAGGSTFPILGCGDVQVYFIGPNQQKSQILLHNCAHIPALFTNLFSIPAIDNAEYTTTFKSGKVTVTAPVSSTIIGFGSQHTGSKLYYMNIELITQEEVSPAVQMAYSAITWSSHVKTWEQWHRVIEQVVKEEELPIIAESSKNYQCEACITAKQHVAPFPQESQTQYKRVGNLIVSDVWGPAQVEALQGDKYFVTFIDVFSRFTVVYFMKSVTEVRTRYKDFEALVKTQTGGEIKRFRTDGGPEYQNDEEQFKNRKLDAKLNKYRFTGYGEGSRAFRYYKPESRQILLTRNAVFVPPLRAKDIDYDDLDEAELPLAGVVGLSFAPVPSSSSQPSTIPVAPVKVQPKTPPSTPSRSSAPPPPPSKMSQQKQPRFTRQVPGISYPSVDRPRRSQQHVDYKKLHETSESTPDSDTWPEPWLEEEEEQPQGSKATSPPPSEAEVDNLVVTQEQEWIDYVYAVMIQPLDEDHPSYEDTLTSGDADKWSQARDEEIACFQRFKTFQLVDLPPGFKPLKSRWVNVAKRNADGIITRHRARLVVKGYGQRTGIDFGEVFANVLRSDLLRILLALATIYDWDMYGLDVKSAFLNGRVEEELYMDQIPGYEDGTNCILKIVGSLYGLKQAPRIWNQLFAKKIVHLGYKRAPSDPSVYTRIQDDNISILAVYVDDIAVFTTKGHVTAVIKELQNTFDMRDLGELSEFLGYKISRDRSAMTITLSQETYVNSIVTRAGMESVNPTKLPMQARMQYSRYTGNRIDFPYATHIGELLYLALGTSPDIAYAVQHMSQFTLNPGPEHIAGIKQIYHYLRGTTPLGITYCGKKD